MAGFIGFGALCAFATAVFLATQFLVRQLVPTRARLWAAFPIAAVLIVLPFADELYNERETRLACGLDGGFAVHQTIAAHTREEGIAQIQTVKLDSEERSFYRHELLFMHRSSGEELGRLRWFDRKHGWLQGNAPGAGYGTFFKSSPCPDPQPYLANAAARAQLVRGER